jgi:hypothetical protein
MSAPIIFCHYGMSSYLRFTLLSSKLSNPDKNIYLLGDEENEMLCHEIGVKHVNFSQFDNSQLVLKFHESFRFISGKKHGREEWTKFVFLRWFYICEFIYLYEIDSFWHFDSDNLIVANLFQKELIFNKFDTTEQCGGLCMNGYISSKKITQLYVHHILELFNDIDFLKIQKEKCEINESFAFTEMAAYNHFKKVLKINSVRLNNFENGDTFDDCIAFDDGMAHTKEKYNGYTIKEIYINANNEFYFKLNSTENYIKVNSINLSWMPFSVVLRLFLMFCRSKIPLLRIFRKVFFKCYQKINFNSYSYYEKIIDKFAYKYIKLKY